jgi:hypothetical protein
MLTICAITSQLDRILARAVGAVVIGREIAVGDVFLNRHFDVVDFGGRGCGGEYVGAIVGGA